MQEVGAYFSTEENKSHWRVLVCGSSQFVYEKYFNLETAKVEDSIIINGVEYCLVPKHEQNKSCTEYYELIREYPGSPKIGTKIMVHGTCVNYVEISYTLEGLPKYEDLKKFPHFWKKTCI